MNRNLSCVGLALILFLGSGCALLGKSDPMTPRFFSPDATAAGAPGSTVSTTSAGPTADASRTRASELRLGRVASAVHLREKITYRSSNHEVGYYDERRWTERPEVYVKRALERRLFESGAFAHVMSGEAPTLDVEIVAFGELRGERTSAEIKMRVVLHDDRIVRYEETIAVDEPIGHGAKGGEGEALAAAIARAIQRSSDRIAESTERALGAPPPAR